MKTIFRTICIAGLLLSGTGAMAQLFQVQDSLKVNQLTAGIRLTHLYDLKFQPNTLLPSGFVAEDMKGLSGPNTGFDMAFGLNAAWHFSPLFSLDASFDWGKMTGAGKYEYYESKVSFFSLGGNFSLKTLKHSDRYKWVPYVRVSLGTGHYDSKRRFVEDKQSFNTTNGTCLQSGLGLGVRYYLNDRLSLNLASEFVTSYTDAWDGYDNSNGYDRMLKTRIGVNYSIGKGRHMDREPLLRIVPVMPVQPAATRPANDSALLALQESLRTTQEQMAQMREQLDSLSLAKQAPAQQEEPSETEAETDNSEAIRDRLFIEMSVLYFQSGSSRLNEASCRQLNRIGVILKNNKDLKVQVLGYADNTGEDGLNRKISQKRAEAVVAYLVAYGVDPTQLSAEGMGDGHPVDNRKGSGALANNRRVEFVIQ